LLGPFQKKHDRTGNPFITTKGFLPWYRVACNDAPHRAVDGIYGTNGKGGSGNPALLGI